jgi:glycerol-1-phosphate dehydrogenase [NAD(P)+]
MLAGFAMQYAKSSRPASGGEHYISHFWDMTHHTFNGQGVSHGFQVAIGTLAVLSFYEQLLKKDLAQLDPAACAAQWPEWPEVEKQIRSTFGGSGFEATALSESKAKYADRKTVAVQLEIVRQNWPALKARFEKQVLPVDEAKRRLAAVGAPTEPEHIGISREKLRDTLRKAFYIRNRLTIFDLTLRAGLFESCVDGIFGKGGRWEI